MTSPTTRADFDASRTLQGATFVGSPDQIVEKILWQHEIFNKRMFGKIKDGKVVHLKGYGHRDVTSKAPVTPDTLFQIASTSKAFTALAVMMLVDEGKLKLADRPVTYVPDFKISSPATDQAITVFDLLTHRSGLPRTDAAWVIGQGLTRPELIRAIATLKPTAKLGAKWQYQNMLYVAVGEVAAAAAGTSFEQLVSDRLFKPLGMKAATFDHAKFLAAPDRVAGYDSTGADPVPLLRVGDGDCADADSLGDQTGHTGADCRRGGQLTM